MPGALRRSTSPSSAPRQLAHGSTLASQHCRRAHGPSALVGMLLGYSLPMSISVGLTGETPAEIAAIEHEILPKIIIAGFATVTISSVIITSIIASCIGTT